MDERAFEKDECGHHGIAQETPVAAKAEVETPDAATREVHEDKVVIVEPIAVEPAVQHTSAHYVEESQQTEEQKHLLTATGESRIDEWGSKEKEEIVLHKPPRTFSVKEVETLEQTCHRKRFAVIKGEHEPYKSGVERAGDEEAEETFGPHPDAEVARHEQKGVDVKAQCVMHGLRQDVSPAA